MKKTFIDGVGLGVFLTLLGITTAAFLFDLRFFGNDEDDYVQTIVTSLVAAGAAYLALLGVRQQIQQSFQIEDERRIQSLRASRALLPLTLTMLIRVTESVLKHVISGDFSKAKAEIDSIAKSDANQTLANCIQYSDSISGDRISQLIRYIQVLSARIDEEYFKGEYPPYEQNLAIVGHGRTGYMIDWVVFAAICNSLFPYARGSEEQISRTITLGDADIALKTCGIFRQMYPALWNLIKQRAEGNRLEIDFRRD